ncbi:MAG TPA: tetratricopeptide repeat protein [Cyclobacteriaceae bacterium]|nr:tetratricopeptide repeat protein [Cyclobacteriaceae bacterium]
MNILYNTYYTYILISKYNRVLLTCFCILTSSVLVAQNVQDIQLANEYLIKGDKEKALDLYHDLARNDNNISAIHNNYFNVLLDLGKYDEAKDYLRKLLKKEPSNLQYKLDLAVIYVRSEELSKADKYIKDIIADNKSNVQAIKTMSDYLSSRSLNDYAILALKESREFLGDPQVFSLDLAMLYRIVGDKDKMVQEYLGYVTQSSANIQYVKNVMQALLAKPDELESLEKVLYEKVQKYPDVEVYSDLLIWVTMQQKNFYAAFIQARAYDKRYKNEGEKTMEVAKVALDNRDYKNAARIYRYVTKEYQGTSNYLMARLGLIKTREEEVKSSYPISADSVRTLIDDYDNFINKYPDNAYSLEAQRSEALLYANYMDHKGDAIKILETLIANPKANNNLKAKAKLDLGDIYLLSGEPWESTLLYSQVEKTQRENTIGYEAKLKNAKLSYFKGDFNLAQEHLDILKEATSREIANDAMDLSMLIKENIAVDSSGEALKRYASIELMLYQNKTEDALHSLDSLVNDRNVINAASILDDAYMLEAHIRMQRGEFNKSIELLDKILKEYPDDVLADDAFFMQGDIYERQLKDKLKAMEVYREFLNKFPGSVYAAEARKRFRTLRGDFDNQGQAPSP